MLNIDLPILVEGKYDKIKLSSVVKAKIITTDGFQVFQNDEKKKIIKMLAEKNGIIILTDSDSAGLIIRNFIKNIVPKEKIYNIYSPSIKGKEKRKEKMSKEGLLGVEGMDVSWIEEALKPFAGDEYKVMSELSITKTDFFMLGLSGGKDSSEKRKKLCEILDLPISLSSNAMIEAINMVISKEKWENAKLALENNG